MLFAAGRRLCVAAGCNVDNGKPQTAIEITMRWLCVGRASRAPVIRCVSFGF